MKKEANKGIVEAIEKSGNNGKPGSTHTLAKLCGVTQPAVMHWLYNSCPAEQAVAIEKLTGVERSKIRPDLFND